MTKTTNVLVLAIASVLIVGSMSFSNSYADSQTIALKTGNAPIGNIDPSITMLSKGSAGPFSTLTSSDFTAADVGPNPWVVNPHPAYKPHLSSDPSAEWISTTSASAPITALFSQSFNVENCGEVTDAELTIDVLVDNQLGDSSQEGVYINGNPVSGSQILGVIQQNFKVDQNLGPFDITSMVVPGTNQLYTYMQDNGVVGALQYSATITVECIPPNEEPVCSEATASQNIIWPPNHKFVPISIVGVTDSDSDSVTVTIDGISQDEEVDAKGKGDGNTSPDGQGVGSDTAEVRAERAGTGDGRVYEISFTADDGDGGSCSGSVEVGVPHNKKSTPVNSGTDYDSTVE